MHTCAPSLCDLFLPRLLFSALQSAVAAPPGRGAGAGGLRRRPPPSARPDPHGDRKASPHCAVSEGTTALPHAWRQAGGSQGALTGGVDPVPGDAYKPRPELAPVPRRGRGRSRAGAGFPFCDSRSFGREAHLPTLQAGPQTPPRVSRAHGHRRRPQGAGQPPRQGPQASVRLRVRGRMPVIPTKRQDSSAGILARGRFPHRS